MALPGAPAAALTGVLVGLVGCLATVLSLLGCDAVRGASSCGGPAGFFLLVATLVVMVLVGRLALAVFGLDAHASSMSFLGVGIIAVVTMLVLLDSIYSPWMFLVIPLVGAGSFLLSHWVTTRFDDSAV